MSEVFLGTTPIHHFNHEPQGSTVTLNGESFYRIRHVDQMPTFFMSLVSGSDHWLFIASNGGITAGRTNAESALFPYETEDKLIANGDRVGSTTLLRVKRLGQTYLWEPLTQHGQNFYEIERNLYKNISGSKLIFEEINRDLQLTWKTSWRTGDRFGFIKTSRLQNDGEPCTIEVVDGLQNVLPYGVTSSLQNSMSNLLNAYKRSELEPQTGIGIFTLSATLTDRPEPSESLMATLAWQVGLDSTLYLLTNNQLEGFRHGKPLTQEEDIFGQPAAFLAHASFDLQKGDSRRWYIVADVNQDRADLVRLERLLQRKSAHALIDALENDIDAGAATLVRYVAAADGLQTSADQSSSARHFANVMFNIMRGGIFNDGYQIDKSDLADFLQTRNRPVFEAHRLWFDALPEPLTIQQLYAAAAATGSADVQRLCAEYLPLTFSRRHGDPSRPWNRFSINLKHEDGSTRLDYQGNWRDIFQNWEPLLLAFPAYTRGVIAKFLNAITVDGYNPYRVTRDGIEWEVPEPDNPWSNIGYWSDHQIIYLQKLLELSEQVDPGSLVASWQQPIFAYANVPYRLKPYHEMLADWSNTITFDKDLDDATVELVDQLGTDGRLVQVDSGQIIHATMTEKLLVLLLAKLVNLVPEGGIWMNTQRPEWNDANNALVGKGLSVVTAAYLRRFVVFWRQQLNGHEDTSFLINTAAGTLLQEVSRIYGAFSSQLDHHLSDQQRRAFMDELGAAATGYRTELYEHGVPQEQVEISGRALVYLLIQAQEYLDHTLRANRRNDGLYHAYNILVLDDGQAAVEHLYLMLEGQVAMLSSGLLDPDEAVALLESLRHSDLYRADQHSYMLYPNRRLPGFRQKNNVASDRLLNSPLIKKLTEAGDKRLLILDEAENFHFNGRFRNAGDLQEMLDTLAEEPRYRELVDQERENISEIFEETFNHKSFTGRSGTFFAYEGLGSIYWHMVSKLLLAVQENLQSARRQGAPAQVIQALVDAYYDVREGLGFNKTPSAYGAFPADPYSHTPINGGARQPGMTGQVKEEILTRWGELGVQLEEGKMGFDPHLLRPTEFFTEENDFYYIGLDDDTHQLKLPAGSLAFTFCQTPIIYQASVERSSQIDVLYKDGRRELHTDLWLTAEQTGQIFSRDGEIQQVWVTFPQRYPLS